MSSTAETRAGGPIVGIDLGTTNSLVAVAGWPGRLDLPRVIEGPGGVGGLLPSVVRYGARGAVVEVGAGAKARAAEFPRLTVGSAKRLMGRSARDAQGDAGYVSYSILAGEGDTARIELGEKGSGVVVSPQQVGAEVLKELKRWAEAELQVKVERAVITVPAYFDDAQRQATRDAARLAGLNAVRIVAEPTAAALAYGLGLRRAGGGGASSDAEESRERVVVVYDLGGGTFDVSVLRITPGVGGGGEGGEDEGSEAFEVLATAGDTHLGGDDFDHALMGLIVQKAVAAGGLVLDERGPSAELKRALLHEAERVKIALSDAERVAAVVGGARVEVTRGEFEGLIEPWVERTLRLCERALRDASRHGVVAVEGMKPEAVVMVGGSTRVPRVRAAVEGYFGMGAYYGVDPDKVVALGAAVQASLLSGVRRDAMLLDVIPLSLGIETAGGATAKIIVRNTPIPAMASEMFSTQVDNQTAVKLNIVQGEREMAGDCRSLGVYHLRGIPAMPAGIPQVKVEFRVDANGVLSVSAVERRSGKRLQVQVAANHGLSREEVERLEAESFEHAREDMTRHRVADLVANAKLDVHWIGKQLAKHGGKLEEGKRAEIEAALTTLRGMIELAGQAEGWKRVNADEMHRAKEGLDRASMALHEVSIAESLRGNQ